LVEEGVCPEMVQDIREDPRLLKLSRELSHNMMSLMHHIGGATRLIEVRRDVHVDT